MKAFGMLAAGIAGVLLDIPAAEIVICQAALYIAVSVGELVRELVSYHRDKRRMAERVSRAPF